VTGNGKAEVAEPLDGRRPVLDQLVADPGKELLELVEATRQQGMYVATLGHRAPVLVSRGKRVAVDHGHALVGVRQGPGRQEPGDAAADHDGVVSHPVHLPP
jgi:hypothetical protein